MGELSGCPRTGGVCANQYLCTEANIPLQHAIPRIRREVGDVGWKAARVQLEHEITAQGDILRGVDLHPSFDDGGSATICPGEILEDGLAERIGRENAAATLRSLSERCITNAISYLNYQQGNY